MNEETIMEKHPSMNGQKENRNEGADWKKVTLGGVSGILMGAGLLYAGQIAAKELGKEALADDTAPEQGETSHTLENGLQVAAVSDDLSFGEAFAQARAEVGPGGVFHWHGGIYNTYTAAEWNAMTVEQKHDFAQQVKPEISADEIPTPTDSNTHVIVEHHVYHHDSNHPVNDAQASDDVQVANQQANNADSDVHIVGYGDVRGHSAVALDMNGDGQADVAIIDVDDSGDVSNPDVMVDRQGNMATIGELRGVQDPNMTTNDEAPDMTDDAQMDAGFTTIEC